MPTLATLLPTVAPPLPKAVAPMVTAVADDAGFAALFAGAASAAARPSPSPVASGDLLAGAAVGMNPPADLPLLAAVPGQGVAGAGMPLPMARTADRAVPASTIAPVPSAAVTATLATLLPTPIVPVAVGLAPTGPTATIPAAASADTADPRAADRAATVPSPAVPPRTPSRVSAASLRVARPPVRAAAVPSATEVVLLPAMPPVATAQPPAEDGEQAHDDDAPLADVAADARSPAVAGTLPLVAPPMLLAAVSPVLPDAAPPAPAVSLRDPPRRLDTAWLPSVAAPSPVDRPAAEPSDRTTATQPAIPAGPDALAITADHAGTAPEADGGRVAPTRPIVDEPAAPPASASDAGDAAAPPPPPAAPVLPPAAVTATVLAGRAPTRRADAAAPRSPTGPIAIAVDPRASMPPAVATPLSGVGSSAPAAQAFAAAIEAADRQDRAAAVLRDPGTGAAVVTAATTVAPAAAAGGQPGLDLARHDWPAAMIDRIEALRDAADAGSTRIRVVPDALGSIDVSLRRHDDGAVQVALAADHPATQALLAEARPELTRLGEARGLRLADAPAGLGGTAGQGTGADQRRAAPPAMRAAPTRPPATDDQPDAAAGRVA